MRPQRIILRCLRPRLRLTGKRKGMTFVEILIAIFVTVVVSIALYASAVFTLRQTHANLSRSYAIQATNSLATRLRASKLTNLIKNPADMENPSFERTNFFNLTGNINTDPISPHQTQLAYTIELKGFGNFTTQAGVTNNIYSIRLPARSGHWKANEFAGYMVTIISGLGQNQIGRIVSHSASTTQGTNKVINDLRITSDVSLTAPNNNAVWSVRPDSTSMFLLNYGVSATILTTWDNAKKSIQELVYVPY